MHIASHYFNNIYPEDEEVRIMRKELTNLRGEGLVTEVSLDVWEVAGVSAGNTPPPARIMGSSSKRADPSASAATAASLLPAMSPVHEEAGIKTVYVMVDINNFASIAEGLKKEEWENTLGRAVKFVAFCGAGVTWTSGEFDHIQVGKRTLLDWYGSYQNLSRRLLEFFRNRWIAAEAFDVEAARRIQIRFDSS